MGNIVLADLHNKLTAAGIPILSVRLTKEQDIEPVFQENVTDKQETAALTIIKNYDQVAEDATKVSNEITQTDIENAKSVTDLKALLVKMLNKG